MIKSDSAGSDLQVFDDPSIQNDPKLTGSKKHSLAVQKNEPSGARLPPGLPIAPPLNQVKRWKSTRETQNFQLKQSSAKQSMNTSSSNSKLPAKQTGSSKDNRKRNNYTLALSCFVDRGSLCDLKPSNGNNK